MVGWRSYKTAHVAPRIMSSSNACLRSSEADFKRDSYLTITIGSFCFFFVSLSHLTEQSLDPAQISAKLLGAVDVNMQVLLPNA